MLSTSIIPVAFDWPITAHRISDIHHIRNINYTVSNLTGFCRRFFSWAKLRQNFIYFLPLTKDTWSCRGLPLLSHFINFSPHNHLVVIYRNNQELCFLKRKIRKNVDFIQWKLNVNPPSIDEKKFIYISNVWPGNDQISWWLNGIRQNFVAGEKQNCV